MKKILNILLLLIVIQKGSIAQVIDVNYQKNNNTMLPDSALPATPNDKIQILKNGFVDFLSDGTIQASARLLRINIGERDKFYLPLYIYTGASGKAFGQDKLIQTTVSNLLNPIGGTVNLSFIGMQNLIKGCNITNLNFAYQVGGRLVGASDSTTKSNSIFLNGFTNVGLFFQTGAWTPEDPNNMGVFYVQAKFCVSLSPRSNLEKVFGKSLLSHDYFLGYSLDAGIEINKIINLKLGLYQYTNNQNISLLNQPVIKFSIDYSFN